MVNKTSLHIKLPDVLVVYNADLNYLQKYIARRIQNEVHIVPILEETLSLSAVEIDDYNRNISINVWLCGVAHRVIEKRFFLNN